MSVSELLRLSELFYGLTSEQIEQIANLGQEKVYNARDIVIAEGDPSDEIYIVCGGMVEVEVSQKVETAVRQLAQLGWVESRSSRGLSVVGVHVRDKDDEQAMTLRSELRLLGKWPDAPGIFFGRPPGRRLGSREV